MPLVNYQSQTIDAEGRFVPSRVTVYYRNTLDLASQDIFLRSNGGGIANPFNADDGYISFWANPGAYDVRMEDQSVPARFAARTVGFDAVSGDVGGIPLEQVGADIARQMVPIGSVIDWWRPVPPSGSPAMTVPSGFEICDGRTIVSGQHDFGFAANATLPDLRNKFILGADHQLADLSAGGAATSPGIGGAGGAHSKLIDHTEAPVPAHGHTTNNPSHGHSVSDPGHAHTAQVRRLGDASPGANKWISWNSNLGTFSDAQGQAIVDILAAGTNVLVNDATTSVTVNANSMIPAQIAQDRRPAYFGMLKIMKVRRA